MSMSEWEIQRRLEEIEDMDWDESYEAALELEKDAPEAAAIFLSEYYASDDPERSLAYALRALEKYPNNGELWMTAGLDAYCLEDFASAVNYYRRATYIRDTAQEAAPSYADACREYALVLREENPEDASVWCAEACVAFEKCAADPDIEMSEFDWSSYACAACLLLDMDRDHQLAAPDTFGDGLGSAVLSQDPAAYHEKVLGLLEDAGLELFAQSMKVWAQVTRCKHGESDAFPLLQAEYVKMTSLAEIAEDEEKSNWECRFDQLEFDYQDLRERFTAPAAPPTPEKKKGGLFGLFRK